MYSREILLDRALCLKKARSFFSDRKYVEVDVPAITKHPSIDLHIEVMQTKVSDKETGYLHTSPEYLMKRLLSFGLGDIYYLGHVFRKNELGQIHNPEFTMAEWYRSNTSYENFLNEIVEFIQLFLPCSSFKRLSYRETFLKYTQMDYLTASKEELFNFAKKHIDIDQMWDKDTLLNLILSHLIEPCLGRDELFILDSYPASQAALAKTKMAGDEEVAMRFEFYYNGIELANGFHELSCSKEQRRRFLQENEKRKANQKKPLELDEKFLEALERGIGDCFGVAAGFDRLFMLKHKKKELKEVIPFSWEEI